MHCLSYLLKLISYPVISTFNTDSFASSILYISSFTFNTLRSKPVNLKSVKTMIMNHNNFILRAEILGIHSDNYWDLCSSPKFHTVTVAHPASYSDGTVSPFPMVHWQRCETDRSLPPSAEIVNVWSNTATPPYDFAVSTKRKYILLLLSM